MKNPGLSIVVPTLNEEGNVEELVTRLDRTLSGQGIDYEVIFVDDHSTDGTQKKVLQLGATFPVILRTKKGQPGKAVSLLEGFGYAQKENVAMIDADLQYPPEAIPEMFRKLATGYDIVVAKREERQVSLLRKLFSKSFNFIFAQCLHGMSCDVQAGLKVFRRGIVGELDLHPTPWTFDLEFLVKARNNGHRITGHPITFSERRNGASKIKLLRAVYEIGWSAIRLKFNRGKPSSILPKTVDSMVGAGLAHRRKRFITHTTLSHDSSALVTFSTWQKIAGAIALLFIVIGLFLFPFRTAVIVVALLSGIYFIDVLFNFYLVAKSLTIPPEIHFDPQQISAIADSGLPTYTILCPLYREAEVLPEFLRAIHQLDWPKDKLDVILLLEEDDQDTQRAVNSFPLQEYVRTLIVPHSLPKTKPKACNYGLSHSRGEYLVIYDAEDIPEPQQLKKAYLGFQSVPSEVKCLQAKLNYHNPHHNLLTRLFTAEYSLWFDVILTGLQTVNTYIPLGGTSNHFRTADLLKLEGWDPFNVTEDCDLGVRLFVRGAKTAIIDSTTLEEANSSLWNWLRQRSRWIKGYMQTYLVHMRHPIQFARDHGIHALIFQLVVGGKIAFLVINPILWLATISYFVLYSLVGPTIESLYPPVVFYMAAFSLLFGNFLYLYYYMIGCAKRDHWPVIKYVFFVPFYWLAASVAAAIAIYQLFIKPHYWEKTLHGLSQRVTPRIQPAAEQAPKLVPVHFEVPEPALGKEKPKFWWNRFLPEGIDRNTISGGALLMAAMMISNFINFLFNAFLGRVLDFERLALVTFVNTLWSLAAIFVGALSSTVNHRTAALAASKDQKSADAFWRWVQRRSLIVAFVFSTLWLAFAPLISNFFRISDPLVLVLFIPALSLGLVSSTNRAYLNGNLMFAWVAMLFVLESVTKFIIAAVLISLHLDAWVYLSIPISILVSALGSTLVISRFIVHTQEPFQQTFPTRFFGASLLSSISATLFLSLDILLVKHFFNPQLAGQYVSLSLVGKMVYFFGSLPSIFMITLVSRDVAMRRNPKRTFVLLSSVTFYLICFIVLLLGPLGSSVVPFLLGSKSLAILPYLNIYVVSIALFTFSNIIVSYHLARKQYIFPAVSLFASIVLAIGIILYHGTVEDITRVIFAASAAGLAITGLLHLLEKKLQFLASNIADLLGVFSKLPQTQARSSGKNILVFNWRDLKHNFAGGAEVYVTEIAKHWVARGHRVTLFCGNDGKSPREEIIDGIEIIRRGGFYFVYVWAFVYYLFRFRGKYDVIIDCQNGVPFFTPLYARTPIYCLMHHVHQEVFRRSLIKPLAYFAQFLEKTMMPLVYRNIKFITVSESSKQEMQSLGLGRAGIEVVYPGVDLKGLTPGEKSKVPSILYLGRLKAYKSLDVLLRAFRLVLQKTPGAHLVVAGSGEEDVKLKKTAKTLGVDKRVQFTGQVTAEQKLKLLQEAWVFVNPSMMEGWGITTIEANACGTPIVASDVPGLRDSVLNPETGFLIPHGDSAMLADRLVTLLRDTHLRDEMGAYARTWAQKFDWQASANKFFEIINEDHQIQSNQYVTEEI